MSVLYLNFIRVVENGRICFLLCFLRFVINYYIQPGCINIVGSLHEIPVEFVRYSLNNPAFTSDKHANTRLSHALFPVTDRNGKFEYDSKSLNITIPQ